MKKLFIALMAVAAIAMTSCENKSLKDIVTDVETSGQNEGAFAGETLADVYVQAIAAEQGGSAVAGSVVLKGQSDDSKAKAAALTGAEKAKATILAQKTYELIDCTVQVTEGSASDNDATIEVKVSDKTVLTHYYKVAK